MKKLLIIFISIGAVCFLFGQETKREQIENFVYKLCCQNMSIRLHTNACSMQDVKAMLHKDQHFKKGIEAILFEKTRYLPKRGNIAITIPDYDKALTALFKSTVKHGNTCAALAGLRIMNIGFSLYAPNKKMAQKFHIKDDFDLMYKTFVDTLRKKTNSCYSYLFSIRYYLQYKNDLQKAVDLFEHGKSVCEKEPTPWIKKNFFIEGEKAKYINMRRLKKEKAKKTDG